MINNASDLKNYQSNVKNELKNHIQRKGVLSIETEKNIFQKNMVKNIVAKEIFSFMGNDTENTTQVVAQEKEPILYNLYNMIGNSLDYYTINELQQYRKYIQTLATKKQKSPQYMQVKSNNPEKYLLGLVGNEKIFRDSDFQKEKNSYALFFDLFQTKAANKDIIDLQALKIYTEKTELETNQDQTYLQNTDKKQKFFATVAEFENHLDIMNILHDNNI